MALLLNIDTAGETATITIAEKEEVIGCIENANQKDHAAFLHTAIQQLLQNAEVPMNKVDAIAVAAGPGSYTGLRVGMASAKGLCYALDLPLITINTLEILAMASIDQIRDPDALYCPMIDARRMEVFTAVYDCRLKEILSPSSLILNDLLFKELLESTRIYFSGSGSLKWGGLLKDKNGVMVKTGNTALAMAALAFKNYQSKNFADLAYTSPLYLKEFYTARPGDKM